MGYVNLREMLARATEGGYAVGAFNVVDAMTARAVIGAAEAKRSPVIVQTSPKTVRLYGVETMAGMVQPLAVAASVPVALHLDHCRDMELIRDCIETGWTSIMIDASRSPFDENVRLTREVVEMAGPHDVTVEGELGSIMGVEDEVSVEEAEASLADPEQAVRFVERTGVEVLAPAIGTAHGMYKGEPKIDFGLLERIAGEVDAAIAIHGGTGLSDDAFSRCVELGGAKVNISTQIKHAFQDALAEYFQKNPDEYEPVKSLAHVRERTRRTAEAFIDKFGSGGKA